MKTPIISLCIVFNLFPMLLLSQIDEWTPAIPLTDSLSDNKNAIVQELKFYSGWDHYVIWQKSIDSNSSSIYSLQYYSADEPVALVDDGNNNTDPCVLKLVTVWDDDMREDTTFYLVYLSDLTGNFDLYYRKYSSVGFTEPYTLTQTPGDEKHLRSNGINGLTWEYEGTIKFIELEQVPGSSYTFSETIVVDSGNCSNPVTETIANFGYFPSYIAYEKVIDGMSKIMISRYDFWHYTWGIPEAIYDTGNNVNLKFSESSFDQTGITLSWDNIDEAGQRKSISYDPYEEDFYFLEYTQPSDFMSSTFNIFIGVAEIWGFALQSFIMNDNGQGDIYGGYIGSWFPYGYTNLSSSSAPDMNPRLWNGTYYYDYQDVINIWESYRNGHWQLWTSKIQVPLSGGVNEQAISNSGDLRVFPNPFNDEFTVKFNSQEDGNGILVISDLVGRRAVFETNIVVKGGENAWKIDSQAFSSISVSSGIFLIQLELMDKVFSHKIIKIID